VAETSENLNLEKKATLVFWLTHTFLAHHDALKEDSEVL